MNNENENDKLVVDTDRDLYDKLKAREENAKGKELQKVKTEKWKAVEDLCKIVVKQISEIDFAIGNYTQENEQCHCGDFVILWDNEKKTANNVECKKSYSYKNINKLGIDILFYKYGTNFTEPYVQTNTRHNRGYLFNNKSSILITFNCDSDKLVIINDWNIVKENLKELALEFLFTDKIRYVENKEKIKLMPREINGFCGFEYLDLIKTTDKFVDNVLKEEIIFTLNLDKVDKYSNDYIIYDIVFNIIDNE